ncbi:MAG: LysR family transcriptional regulator [Pseudomonadota bacterium]
MEFKSVWFFKTKLKYDMNWKDIPSLHALRAFEAVARGKSFTGAARELNVTEAAVRQHVRGLEKGLKTKLVARSGKGLALTPNGEQLSEITSDSFQTLAHGLRKLAQSEESKPVTVTLPPAFAEIWLMPKLEAFWRQHPSIQVNLTPSLSLADPRKDDFDLAIRYGRGDWEGLDATLLASAQYVVVAKTGLIAGDAKSSLDKLRTYPWLFEKSRQEHRDWAETHGLDFEAETNRHYPTNSLVIAAARAGHGVSLQARALVQADLELGLLEELYAEENTPLGYYLVAHGPLDTNAKTFATWLLQSANTPSGP